MNAAIADDEMSASLLLSNAASWSTQGRFGFTALFWAEASRQSRSLCLLPEDGGGGRGSEDSRVAALLIGKGATLSSQEEEGLRLLKARYADGSPEVKSLLTLRKHAVILCSKPPDATSTMHSYMMARIIDGADKFETQARDVLKPGWKPTVTLEQSILNLDTYKDANGGKIPVCEKWHQDVPGEGDFPDWKSLVQHSKLFVQERVAWGDELPPQYIFALHLYTIPCNLFSKCCAAMRATPKKTDDGETRKCKHAGLEPFRVFIWYLWQALEKIRVQPYSVYRGISGDATQLLPENGRLGNALLWPAFSSTSCSMDVANSFLRAGNTGGILFKILAKRTREIADYSYRPHERELLLAPMTRLNILGVYEASHYNMQYGEHHATATDSSMPAVNSVPPRRLDSGQRRAFVVPPEYAGKYVLVIMEEADLLDQE